MLEILGNGTARVGRRTCNAKNRRFRIPYSPHTWLSSIYKMGHWWSWLSQKICILQSRVWCPYVSTWFLNSYGFLVLIGKTHLWYRWITKSYLVETSKIKCDISSEVEWKSSKLQAEISKFSYRSIKCGCLLVARWNWSSKPVR